MNLRQNHNLACQWNNQAKGYGFVMPTIAIVSYLASGGFVKLCLKI